MGHYLLLCTFGLLIGSVVLAQDSDQTVDNTMTEDTEGNTDSAGVPSVIETEPDPNVASSSNDSAPGLNETSIDQTPTTENIASSNETAIVQTAINVNIASPDETSSPVNESSSPVNETIEEVTKSPEASKTTEVSKAPSKEQDMGKVPDAVKPALAANASDGVNTTVTSSVTIAQYESTTPGGCGHLAAQATVTFGYVLAAILFSSF